MRNGRFACVTRANRKIRVCRTQKGMKGFRIGKVSIGKTPRVVGCLSTLREPSFVAKAARLGCDLVEMRIDRIGPFRSGWMDNARGIEKAGVPVIVTLRWAREGGLWTESDLGREPILLSAIEAFSCVDIELASALCLPLARRAEELGKRLIVSFHDFRLTPPLDALRQIVRRINRIPCAIPKIATMVTSEADIFALRSLLESENERPLCVIGMGPLGSRTRLLFPSLGSCLAYGYLDVPAAPGQLRASAIAWQLKTKEVERRNHEPSGKNSPGRKGTGHGARRPRRAKA